MIEEIQGKHPEATALEVWFQDEPVSVRKAR